MDNKTVMITMATIAVAVAICVAAFCVVNGGNSDKDDGDDPYSPTTYPITIKTYDQEKGRMVDMTFNECPKKVVCVQGGAFEFMLALGLGDYIEVAYIAGGADGYPYMSKEIEQAAKKVDVRDRNKINKEEMVLLKPDLIVGWPSVFLSTNAFCTGTMDEWKSRGTNCYAYGTPATSIQDYYDHLTKVASVFGVQENADKIINEMKRSTSEIAKKVDPIPESSKPTVLPLVLSAGYILRAYGNESLAGQFIESAGAKLAWEGNLEEMSLEKIADIKPDVIIFLISGNDWQDPARVKEYEDWLYGQEGLASVPAIKDHRVYSYGLSEVSITSVPPVDIFDRIYKDLYG